MNFVIPQTRALFKSINGFFQFTYHRLWIILNKVFWLHCINCFINIFIQKRNLYIHLCKTIIKMIYNVIIVLRNQRESLFVINAFLLVKLLAIRQTLYISILSFESHSTIDIYLKLMGFLLSQLIFFTSHTQLMLLLHNTFFLLITLILSSFGTLAFFFFLFPHLLCPSLHLLIFIYKLF